MPTANEIILDSSIRRQIGLVRVSNRMRSQILNHLQRTERDLKDQIIAKTAPLQSSAGGGFALDRTARQRLSRLEQTIEKVRSPAFSGLLDELTGELNAIALDEPRFLANLTKMASPVSTTARLPTSSELRKIVTSRPFQGRILKDWTRLLEADERRRIMNEIRIGLTQGETVNAIAARIVGTAELAGRDGVTQITRAQAQTIVRTSVTHIAAAAGREFAEANKRLFKKEVWTAVLDDRTSQTCLDLNGRLFDVGKGIHPPAHYNCRSRRVPFISNTALVRQQLTSDERRRYLRDFTRREGMQPVSSVGQLTARQRARFDGFVRERIRQEVGGIPGVPSSEDFLTGLSVSDQSNLLGVTRSRLFRRGNLSIGRLVDRHGRPLTLAELAKTEKDAFLAAGLDPEDFLEP